MKEYLIGILLSLLLLISTRLAYAEICADNNGEITIDGTPHPELHMCPSRVRLNGAQGGGSKSVIIPLNNESKPETVIKTEVITVVVTATPMPSPTAKPYIPYKAVKAVFSTLSPTFTPTATPSATKTPIPTKRPPLKAVENNHNLFQTIIRFFKDLFYI